MTFDLEEVQGMPDTLAKKRWRFLTFWKIVRRFPGIWKFFPGFSLIQLFKMATNQFGGAVNEDGVDAMFILISAFIIFTMQSGFGLLESGKE